jgi:hypothetical protein
MALTESAILNTRQPPAALRFASQLYHHQQPSPRLLFWPPYRAQFPRVFGQRLLVHGSVLSHHSLLANSPLFVPRCRSGVHGRPLHRQPAFIPTIDIDTPTFLL